MSGLLNQTSAKISRVNVATRKMDFWKTFGDGVPPGATPGGPEFSGDGSSYAYVYSQTISQAYVVRGLK